MLQALSTVAAITVFLVLFISSIEHIRSPHTLVRAINTHVTFPQALAWPVTFTVIVVEATLAVMTGFALFADRLSERSVATLLTISGGLFALYAAYTFRVLSRSDGETVLCGCSRTDAPATGWVVIRAGALSFLAMLASLQAHSIISPHESAVRFTLTAMTGTVFAVLLWVLPEAMVEPRPPSPRFSRNLD